ncbi:MAG TPA: type II toxin-antitoxin system HigB family toxin [Terriglobia bacterium]|nr:type II toxin-antitoxin system HigB family toxin [Terriglobia bacterium]
MHVLSRRRLREAALKHNDLEAPLDTWYRIAKKADWKSLADVRKTWASADSVGRYTVFNVKGNDYRLITEINDQSGRVFIRHVMTHREYDQERWKK